MQQILVSQKEFPLYFAHILKLCQPLSIILEIVSCIRKLTFVLEVETENF